jgi:hypothetical protein
MPSTSTPQAQDVEIGVGLASLFRREDWAAAAVRLRSCEEERDGWRVVGGLSSEDDIYLLGIGL